LTGMAVVVVGALVYLWRLGDQADRLPNPAPPTDQLQAAIELELRALSTGDLELLAQLQDEPGRRSNFQPPPEDWLAADGPRSLELVRIVAMSQESGRAELMMNWDGRRYRLYWYYRLVNGRWVHTDWQPADLGDSERLTSSRLEVTYFEADLDAAAALIGRLEGFLADLCRTLECSARADRIAVDISPYLTAYRAESVAGQRNSYQIASPQRVRWPASAQPEPIILASLGRRLAYDQLLEPGRSALSSENQAAATLGAFWLVHHLLDNPIPPAVRWLEQAAERDGLDAAVRFVRTLAAGVPDDSALTLSFRPGTADEVLANPDYLAWRTLIHAPYSSLGAPAISRTLNQYARDLLILQSLDWSAAPWAPTGQVYAQAAPELTEIREIGRWIHAFTVPDSQWAQVYSFRSVGGNWLPAEPDETAFGGQRTVSHYPFFITYYAVDEHLIPQLTAVLDEVYRTVTANFALQSTGTLRIAFLPSSGPRVTGAELTILSPTFPRDRSAYDLRSEAAWNLIWLLVGTEYMAQKIPEESILLFLGALLWQAEQFGYELDLLIAMLVGPVSELVQPGWAPPSTVESPDWCPLTGLWKSPAIISNTPAAWNCQLRYPVLVTAYLVKQRGTGILPTMLRELRTAGSFSSWLTAVVGQSVEEFEPDWRRWVMETVPVSG